MATAVINQLFEEGITRSRELSDASDEAMRAIDDMAREAEDLAQRVEAEVAEARGHIREVAGGMGRAETALPAGSGQAESALTGLAGEAAELTAQAAALLDRVKASLAELDARRESVETDLGARLSAVQDDATELAAKTQAAQASAEESLQQVAQALAGFRAAIDTARAEFAHKQQDWTKATADLELEAATQADAWASGLSDLLERQSTALVEAANSMVGEHNAAMEGVRSRFVQQAPQDLAEALGPLESGLAELGQAAQAREEGLTDEASRLAHWAEASLPLVDGVRTALEAAAQNGVTHG